jgi:hypothetical protein
MAHSVRRTPVLGFGTSEKQNKVAAHRKLRRKIHILEHNPSAELYPETREVSNSRRWRKDPRGWCERTAKALPKLMRK